MDRTLGGKEFQAHAAATGNSRSPRVDGRVDGTTSVDVLADLSRRLRQMQSDDFRCLEWQIRYPSSRIRSRISQRLVLSCAISLDNVVLFNCPGDAGRMSLTHETYLLSADSDDERKDWIRAIKHFLYSVSGGGMFVCVYIGCTSHHCEHCWHRSRQHVAITVATYTGCVIKKEPLDFRLQLSHFLVDFNNFCTNGNRNECSRVTLFT